MRLSPLVALFILVFVSCWSGHQQIEDISTEENDPSPVEVDMKLEQDAAPALNEAAEAPSEETMPSIVCAAEQHRPGMRATLALTAVLFTGKECPEQVSPELEKMQALVVRVFETHISSPGSFLDTFKIKNDYAGKTALAKRAREIEATLSTLRFDKRIRYTAKTRETLDARNADPSTQTSIIDLIEERLACALIFGDDGGVNLWGLHYADALLSAHEGAITRPGVAAEIYLMLGKKEDAAEAAHLMVELALNRYTGTLPGENLSIGEQEDLNLALHWIKRTDELVGSLEKTPTELRRMFELFGEIARKNGYDSAANGLFAFASQLDPSEPDPFYATSPE